MLSLVTITENLSVNLFLRSGDFIKLKNPPKKIMTEQQMILDG